MLKISVVVMFLARGPFGNDDPLAFEIVLSAQEKLVSYLFPQIFRSNISFKTFTLASKIEYL